MKYKLRMCSPYLKIEFKISTKYQLKPTSCRYLVKNTRYYILRDTNYNLNVDYQTLDEYLITMAGNWNAMHSHKHVKSLLDTYTQIMGNHSIKRLRMYMLRELTLGFKSKQGSS